MSGFCKCGSIIIRGNCTNKKCKEYIKPLVDEATFSQIEFIKNLAERLGEDINIDFTVMSKKEASNLIEKLLEQSEV
jgi:hypothetical protein